MDSEYIQQLRYKLQKRLKRLNTASQESFRGALFQTWVFLQDNPITKAILDDLEFRIPEARNWVAGTLRNEGVMTGESELENDAMVYWVVKSCATIPLNQGVGQHGNLFLDLVQDISARLEWFRTEYIEPLFDYIDEHIDDKRMILALLRKYKHRCEWFRRADLLTKWKADTQRGEELLAYDLYEYLHDQGIEFHIEPESEAGRVDLISAQSGKDRLLADAKIFNPDRGQNVSYLGKGFRQLYDYTKTYNEPFGYLVIFKTCEHDLSIQTEHQEQAVPFVTHNNKTIFLVVIDLFQHPEPASKRGKLKSYEVTPAQLFEIAAPEPPLKGSVLES